MIETIYLVVAATLYLLMWIVVIFGMVVGPSNDDVKEYGFFSSALKYWDDRLDMCGEFWAVFVIASAVGALAWPLLLVLGVLVGAVVGVAWPFRKVKKNG